VNIAMKRIIVPAERINMSLLNSRLYLTGCINELIPKIKNILNIFEPIIFPTAISLFFFIAATTDVASSGVKYLRQL
jgi:hypothetical protein